MEGGVVVADGAVGILEAVAGQNADHRGAGWHFIFALEQACHRGSAGGFTEDSLLAAKQLVGRDDLRVGHIQERAIAGFASCQGLGSVDRVANADGGGDGFGVRHRGVVHQWGGSAGLESHHSGQAAAPAGLLIFLETHPIGGDVSGVAHGNAQPVGCITEGIHDFEGRRFLALQPVGIHRVHEGDGILLCRFPNDVEGAVEVAADRQHLSAVHQRLSQFSLGDIAIRDQDERTHPTPPGIGRSRSTGVARAGTNHRFTTGFLGFADGHGHAPVLEGPCGVQAVVFHEHLHALADLFRNRWHGDQRGGAFTQADHGRRIADGQPAAIGLNQSRPVLHHRGGSETPTEVLKQGHRLGWGDCRNLGGVRSGLGQGCASFNPSKGESEKNCTRPAMDSAFSITPNRAGRFTAMTALG